MPYTGTLWQPIESEVDPRRRNLVRAALDANIVVGPITHRPTATRKIGDASSYKDLPEDIPMQLTIGSRVTAR